MTKEKRRNYTKEFKEEAKWDIVDYIEICYNSKKRHSYLGYLSPKEFEKIMFIKKAV